MPRPPRILLWWLVLACALVLAVAAPRGASAADADAGAALERSVRFLQEAQNDDGGFGGEVGEGSDPGFTAWAAYALAAAGINPQDQAKPGGADVHAYLTANAAALFQTTDFDRAALVALASGTSPSEFGGVDPIGAVLSRQLPDGSFPQFPGTPTGWVNATIWSIFPLSALDRPDADAAVQHAAEWLLDRQRPDGSWPATAPAAPPDADMTGAAIQALRAAGRGGGEAERLAFEFLRRAQGVDGGFEAVEGGGSNAATTAWVVQGMWAAGVDPRSWRTASGRDPLSYLASLQRPNGSIGYTATSSTNSLWITAQVGPALAGRAYPLAAVPRKANAPEPTLPEQAPATEAPPVAAQSPAPRRGHGGARLGRGEGVIAGGGGRGAPLFSAPQPQSAGSTPGGARLLRGAGEPASTPRPSAARASARATVGGARTDPGRPRPVRRRPWRRARAGPRDRPTRRDARRSGYRCEARGRGGEGGMIELATLGDGLGDALAQIAMALRVPVLLAAVAVLVACAFELGRYGTELWRRRVRARGVDLTALTGEAAADPANVALYAFRAPGAFSAAALAAVASARASGRPEEAEEALAAYELAVQRRLDRTRILVRAGPAIGLMGTLIPLAPGLEALGSGDVAMLADDLRDAFAATVIGLLVGTVAFALTLSRTRMYTEDLAALERAARGGRR